MIKHIISWTLRNIPRKYIQLVGHFATKTYGLFLSGNSVECSVCNSTFSKFLPYGRLEPRENALCPNCLALERHRLMYLFLQQKTNFFTDDVPKQGNLDTVRFLLVLNVHTVEIC